MAELLDDQRRGLGVDGLVLGGHDAVLHQHLDHRGDALGHAVGQLLHRDGVGDVDLAHHLLALARVRLHAALLALLAALHRGHGTLAALLVGGVGDGQLAGAAAVVLALGAAALLVGGGHLLGDLVYELRAGRPAGLGAGGLGLGGRRIDRLGRTRGGRLGADRGLARLHRLLGGGRGGALLLDLALLLGALGGLLLGAQPGQLGLAGLGDLALALLAVRFLRLGGLDGLQAPLELGVGQVGRGADAAGVGTARGRGAGLGDQNALALVLDRNRLGATMAEALAHMAGLGAAPAQPERLALAGPVLGIHHSVLAFPAGAFPRRSITSRIHDASRRPKLGRRIPDA